MQCIRNQDLLYIILPYFNFCGFTRRKQLFVEFVNRIQNTSGIRIIVAECSGLTPLGKLPGVWKHIKVETEHSLWIKESMINIAVSDLPQNWKYVAWVDADISFLNQNWVGYHPSFRCLQYCTNVSLCSKSRTERRTCQD